MSNMLCIMVKDFLIKIIKGSIVIAIPTKGMLRIMPLGPLECKSIMQLNITMKVDMSKMQSEILDKGIQMLVVERLLEQTMLHQMGILLNSIQSMSKGFSKLLQIAIVMIIDMIVSITILQVNKQIFRKQKRSEYEIKCRRRNR